MRFEVLITKFVEYLRNLKTNLYCNFCTYNTYELLMLLECASVFFRILSIVLRLQS